MKLFLVIKLCFLTCLSVYAQSDTTLPTKDKAARSVSPNAPLIKAQSVPEDALFLVEETYDFGKIPQGKPVTHTFIFVNKGKNPFSLDNVHASCGCTTPAWDKRVILPGDSGTVKVGYNAADVGPFNRSISLIYKGNLSREIYIKGEVWKVPDGPAPLNALIKKINQ